MADDDDRVAEAREGIDLVGDLTGADTAPPVGQPLTSGAPVRYEGSSGGQIGCIPCDGQNRYISIERSDTAVGNSALAGQELVWPQGGQVTDFGVTIGGPNRGRYGVNLFVNGEYSVGCALETGQTSCTMQMDPAQLRQGDRVAIIVGEQGTVDANGVPLERGEFVLEWYFVFEPA